MSVRVFTNLEMMTGGVRPVLHCSQGDIRPFGFNIKWNGQAYNPEGLCVVAIVKKDGNVATVEGTIEDDKVLFETTPQMTVLDGDCAGIVTFVDGDNPVSTLRFVLAVQKDPTVDAVESETDPTGWQAIMEAAEAAAKAWAVGPNGSGEGTDDNNAKYWAEQSHADQIQADWAEADPTAVDYIKNKPSIPSPYTLPIASQSTLGGIKVGNNLTIDQDGKLNAPPAGGIPVQDEEPQDDSLVWVDSDQLGADFCFVGDTEPTNDGSVAVWVDTSEDEIPVQAGAEGVSYDNTESGLTADNVQEAIDEIAGRDNYSTSEQVIGKWIDGKPIYRKTIDIGQLPVATTKNVAHGVSNIGKIMSATGFSFDNGGSCLSLPLVSGTPEYSIAVWCDNTNVKVSTYIDRSAYSGYINLEYTKSTD